MAEPDPHELAERVLDGESAALSDALSLVEDVRPARLPAQRALLAELTSRTPAAHTVVGLTGPPGAGKSTLASALIELWCDRGFGVGMTAVDPSSRRSGGALLGDRARVRVAPGQRVFVRSMAARERLGGLAPATRAAVVVLRAAFPWTLVETVGVGQSEIDVESVADCVALVLQPGSGDTLQFMKAGILEIPDVLVVHKWDLGDLARRTLGDLEAFLATRPGEAPTVLGVSAQTGVGVEALADALVACRAALDRTGALAERRERSRISWALELFVERYGSFGLETLGGRESVERLAREASGSGLDAFTTLATRAGLEPGLP